MSGDGNGIAKRIDSFEKFGTFKWDKALRGWDRYVREEFDDERGDWKKAKSKEDDYQPGLKPDPKQPKEGYEPHIEYDLERKIFKVQSESEPTVFYEVDLIGGHCTCKDHETRGSFCKHMRSAKTWTPF